VKQHSNMLSAVLALFCAVTAFTACGGDVNDVTNEPWLTVRALRVPRLPGEGTPTHESTDLVFLAHRVSYAGLDLAMREDILELRKRITESAQTACNQLAVLFPLADLDTSSCVREAIRDATERADRVIAMAIVDHEFG
jgi:UrcA family protein